MRPSMAAAHWRTNSTHFSPSAAGFARSLDVAGEWWTPLILRDLWTGRRRFDQIQANFGVSRKLLAERLATLVETGAVERRRYQENPPRYEYHLTEKGRGMNSKAATSKQIPIPS